MDFPRFVWIQGQVVPAAEASVSVFDRGLLYGDGLFETMRSYQGRVFALEEHRARMLRSARELGIPMPRLDWRRGIERLLAANRLMDRDASVRITLTRGAGPPGLLPPANPRPTLFAFTMPVPSSLGRQGLRGIATVSVPLWRPPALATYKLLDYVSAILARRQAARQRAEEALYVCEGDVLEATTANIFAVLGDKLCTPPLGGPLPGVTRQFVIRLATELGIKVREIRLPIERVRAADEIFLTSSVVEILPVVRLDGAKVGSGKPGPLTRQLQRKYRQFVDQTFEIQRS